MNLKLENILAFLLPLYVFIVPWQARYILSEYSMGSPVFSGISIYITDIVFFLVAICFFAWGYKNRTTVRQRIGEHKGIFVPFALFLVYGAASLAWTSNMSAGFYLFFRLLQAGLLFFVIYMVPIKKQLLCFALILAGTLQGLLALQQFLLQAISPSTWLGIAQQLPADLGVSVFELADQRWLRAYGSLSHPNILGGFLAITTIISAWWYLDVQKLSKVGILERRNQVLLLTATVFAFVLNLLGLLLSFSRSAMAAFGIAFAIFSVRYARQHKKVLVKLLALMVILFVGLNLVFGNLWLSRYGASPQTERSYTERLTLLDEWKAVVKDDWLAGVGIGGYLTSLQKEFPGRSIYEYQPVHNVWLVMMAELGVIGVFLFIICLASFIFRGFNNIFAYSFVSIVLVTSSIDHYWWTVPFALFLAAIVLAIGVDKSKSLSYTDSANNP